MNRRCKVSDFEGIDWVDPKEMPEAEQEPKKVVAPDGYVKAKIIECSEHIKEENGNKSLKFVYELENGTYKNYREYLSVWHPNPETKKLWNMYDNGFENLDTFTQKHIIARDYHKQMTDFYWNRVKQEVKAKSTKFQYEEWLKEYDEKYIKNYMTRAVSIEVLQELAKNAENSKIIVDIANKRLKSRAKELALKKEVYFYLMR